tara:strand:- start:621 stop:860 length:240 start_codon:yes stop_codon:yes gene_type:complete
MNWVTNPAFFLSIFFLIVIQPVYAYAGPGAAIGALVVAVTVLIAFFFSFIIKFLKFLKKVFFYIIKLFKNKKKLKIKKK